MHRAFFFPMGHVFEWKIDGDVKGVMSGTEMLCLPSHALLFLSLVLLSHCGRFIACSEFSCFTHLNLKQRKHAFSVLLFCSVERKSWLPSWEAGAQFSSLVGYTVRRMVFFVESYTQLPTPHHPIPFFFFFCYVLWLVLDHAQQSGVLLVKLTNNYSVPWVVGVRVFSALCMQSSVW